MLRLMEAQQTNWNCIIENENEQEKKTYRILHLFTFQYGLAIKCQHTQKSQRSIGYQPVQLGKWMENE